MIILNTIYYTIHLAPPSRATALPTISEAEVGLLAHYHHNGARQVGATVIKSISIFVVSHTIS